MSVSCAASPRRARGGARLNLLITVALIGALGYAGYQYVPVAYNASLLKSDMQDLVNNAAVSDKGKGWVEQQLRAALAEYGAPPDARVSVVSRDKRLEARVVYTRTVPLVVTDYQYHFDHTVRSSGFFAGGN